MIHDFIAIVTLLLDQPLSAPTFVEKPSEVIRYKIIINSLSYVHIIEGKCR